jgi:mutual gliding-motility protein MglA
MRTAGGVSQERDPIGGIAVLSRATNELMATLNYGSRQLDCKIVYYGPALGGKTTNLQQLHRMLPAGARGDLTNLATQQDRTLYFDLLPMSLGRVGGYDIRVQLYTVPGQVYYNVTRRVVLSGVDGVVMVFDSDPAREDANYQSLGNLEENLESYKLSMETLPVVLQFNKRDLPNAMDVDFMSKTLNPDGRFEEFEAVAINGDGVQETLKAICSQVFARIEAEIPRRAEVASAPRTLRPRDPAAPAPAASRHESPDSAPAVAQAERAAGAPSPPLRLRQLSEMRLSGIRVGHAVVDVIPLAVRPDAPEFTATVELQPVFGAARTESVQFWRSPSAGTESGPAVYESRPPAGAKPSRMWWRQDADGVPAVSLSWPTALGNLQIRPEGARFGPGMGGTQ